jgi:hypothetical protein
MVTSPLSLKKEVFVFLDELTQSGRPSDKQKQRNRSSWRAGARPKKADAAMQKYIIMLVLVIFLFRYSPEEAMAHGGFVGFAMPHHWLTDSLTSLMRARIRYNPAICAPDRAAQIWSEEGTLQQTILRIERNRRFVESTSSQSLERGSLATCKQAAISLVQSELIVRS